MGPTNMKTRIYLVMPDMNKHPRHVPTECVITIRREDEKEAGHTDRHGISSTELAARKEAPAALLLTWLYIHFLRQLFVIVEFASHFLRTKNNIFNESKWVARHA